MFKLWCEWGISSTQLNNNNDTDTHIANLFLFNVSKENIDYQLKVDKGELTAVVNFEKLTFRALALRRSKNGATCTGEASTVQIM